MPSVPTTSPEPVPARGATSGLDLGSADLVRDPYPALAAERSRHEVVWHEPSGSWLALSHAAAGAVLRERRLGRLWRDREPAAALEPFNLLHRHQMMEQEPPEHTRLRRAVAGAFNRGHVERLRPRVREIATDLLAEQGERFDLLADYAEPLPVLVIAELVGLEAASVPDLRRWSQAIVRMYEPSPSPEVESAAVRASVDFAALVREHVERRRREPAGDLTSDLLAAGLTDLELVATVVLLLNAGHEASVNVFGNGAVGLLRSGRSLGVLRDARSSLAGSSGTWAALLVEEMLRFDSALQLFERTAKEDVEVAGVRLAAGDRIAALLGSANRDPAVFDRPDDFVPDRDPNPHLAFGAGVHFCLGAPLARMELVESLGVLADRLPGLTLAGEPVSRGTFVLRGYAAVPVHG